MCHPGADLQDPDRRPVILHLDPLTHSLIGRFENVHSWYILSGTTKRRRANLLGVHFSQQRSQSVDALTESEHCPICSIS